MTSCIGSHHLLELITQRLRAHSVQVFSDEHFIIMHVVVMLQGLVVPFILFQFFSVFIVLFIFDAFHSKKLHLYGMQVYFDIVLVKL